MPQCFCTTPHSVLTNEIRDYALTSIHQHCNFLKISVKILFSIEALSQAYYSTVFSYLCQRSKGLLPDTGSPYEGNGGGDIQDAVDFLISNFIEMNKLWVRMQHQVRK
jgi:hypothetical protein